MMRCDDCGRLRLLRLSIFDFTTRSFIKICRRCSLARDGWWHSERIGVASVLLLLMLAGCSHDDDQKTSMTGTQNCTITVNGVQKPCSP
jgi:hypothetical protein